MKMKNLLMIKKLLVLVLTLTILISIAGPARAQEDRLSSEVDRSTAAAGPQGPSDPAELEAFLDDLFAKQMEDYHIAGAAISVVKDGQLFFAKGYGYADLEKGIPVDPEQTVFGIGSNGKVLTWTAVMQLVEQGVLDLEADVNTYLDFQIPDTYPQPITLKHLMTHTSGFEDRLFGSAVLDASKLLPVREFLISHMSARVRPPGYAGYANYNAILAGYIVAQVSGQPYDQYIQENILDPLGMQHSTARSQITPDLRANLSVGYTYADGVFQVFPDYIGQPAGMPSGGHHASVTDMGRFMIALLGQGINSNGNIAEGRILEASTAGQMLTTLYTPDPRLRGAAYGLFDWSANGQRTLGHTGYLPPMNSVLLLLPDQNLGVFVVYNSSGGGELTIQHLGFQKAFFDHYYPAPAAAPIQPPADFAARSGRFVGSYNTSSSYTTLIKVTGLFGSGYTSEIRDSGDGGLLLSMMGQEWRFVEVEPLYFRQVDGPFSIVFREDDQGRITHMFYDRMPQYASQKLGWYETQAFNMALALFCVLIFLSMVSVAGFRFILSRRLRVERKPISPGARAAYWILLGTSILNLLVLVGPALGAIGFISNELLDPPLIIQFFLALGVVSAILTACALVYILLAWKDSYWGIPSRLYYTLVTVAALAFVWFLNYWNMLGLRF